MVLRLLDANESAKRFEAVLDASRLSKEGMAQTLGISPPGVTRLLAGARVRRASPQEIAQRVAGIGFLSADAEKLWRFLEGEGDPEYPPLRGGDSNPEPTGIWAANRDVNSRPLRLVREIAS